MRRSGSGLLLEIILSVTISALIMTMSGCGSADEKEKGSRAAINEENSATTQEDTEPYESKAETEASETVEDTDATETEGDTETEAGEGSATEPDRNETEADTQISAEPVTEKPYVPETEATTPAPTEASTPAPTESPTEAPTSAPTQPPTEAPTPAPTEPPTEADTRPTYNITSEEYLAEAEAYLLEYINEYRVAEGNVALQLSNCSKAYAKGRSVQLMSNFAHDTDDQRALATELKYGDYVEPSLYGMSGEPYYEGWGHEAIGRVQISSGMSPQETARELADGFHNSQGHWNYVGSVVEHYKKYTHVAIGISYGGWTSAYCCVYMLDQSYD